MKAAYLLLVLCPVACLLACPLLVESASALPWGEGASVEAASPLPRSEGAFVEAASPLPRGEGAFVEAASPLPRGEGVPRPALSSAGAGRVRGLSGPRSEQVSRHKQPPTSPRRPAVGNPARVRQPGTDNSVRAAKSGFSGHAGLSNVRAPSVTRIVAPTVNNLRHRSPNPAVVGGPAADKANGTGSVSGTRMNRRR